MPLPPLPENSTACLFLHYTAVGIAHTVMLRMPAAGGVPPGDYAVAYANILRQRMRSTDGFQSAEYRAAGAIVTLPIAFTPVAGALVDAPVWDQDPESTQLSLVGRGNTTGRKVRWEFFTGVRTDYWPANNRYNPGAAAPVDTWRTNFANAAYGAGLYPLVTIGGDLLTVYAYVNIRQNSLWQNKQRS